MAHGVVCHFDLPHMAQKVADWTRREGRPRADEMAHGAVCRFELPHVAENNRRVTRVDSSLWPQRTVPKLPTGTNGCQTLKTATLNTSYFCQKRPLCQPPPSPTPPPNSHFVRKVKLRLAYRLAFVTYYIIPPQITPWGSGGLIIGVALQKPLYKMHSWGGGQPTTKSGHMTRPVWVTFYTLSKKSGLQNHNLEICKSDCFQKSSSISVFWSKNGSMFHWWWFCRGLIL